MAYQEKPCKSKAPTQKISHPNPHNDSSKTWFTPPAGCWLRFTLAYRWHWWPWVWNSFRNLSIWLRTSRKG